MLNSVNNSSLVNASLHTATNPLAVEEMFNKHSSQSNSEISESNGLISGASVDENASEGTFNVDSNSIAARLDGSNIRYLGAKSQEDDDQDLGIYGQDDDEGEDDGLSYDGEASSITVSFDSLAADMGASGEKISKGQLFAYLQSLMADNSSGADKAKEIAFVRNLIAKFDTVSGGEDYITSFGGADAVLNSLTGGKPSPDDGVISTFELRA